MAIFLHFCPNRWGEAAQAGFIGLPSFAQAGVCIFMLGFMIAMSTGPAGIVYFQF